MPRLTVPVHLRLYFFRVIGQAEANGGGGTDGRRSVRCQAEHEAVPLARATRLSVIVRIRTADIVRPASIHPYACLRRHFRRLAGQSCR